MAKDHLGTGSSDERNCSEPSCQVIPMTAERLSGDCDDQGRELPSCQPVGSELDTPGAVPCGPVRRTRRRQRRCKNLHKHRLSRRRRRRDRRSLGPAGATGRAPLNDNEFLMSQYTDGLLDETTTAAGVTGQALWASPPAGPPDYSYYWDHPWSSVFMDRDTTACHSPSLSSPGSSSVNSSSVTSDYSSLPDSCSPDPEDNHQHHSPNASPTSPRLAADEALRPGCGMVTEGTDADFLRRNFEEEYARSLTRALEGESREELIGKCLRLMGRLKELEEAKRVYHVPVNHPYLDARGSF